MKLNMPGKGNFPREEGFLRGLFLRENRAQKAFGASVLNEFEFLTMHYFQKNRDGRMTVVYILLLYSQEG